MRDTSSRISHLYLWDLLNVTMVSSNISISGDISPYQRRLGIAQSDAVLASMPEDLRIQLRTP